MENNSLRDVVLNKIDLKKLDFSFTSPPLLVSGMAMMYYGLRRSDKDIDFILSRDDHKNLVQKLKPQAKILEGQNTPDYKSTPEFVDLYGDHGILIYEFELWDNIMLFGYDDLKQGSIRGKHFLVIGLEKLLMFCCVRGVYKERYLDDAKLIAKKLSEEKYKNYKHEPNSYWKEL